MSPITDEDKYVVYHGVEDGVAIFSLFERDPDRDFDRAVRRVPMDPDDVPEGTEFEDHFWVDIMDGEIVELEFDPEFTKQKKEEYQAVEEMHREMQELSYQKLNDDESE